MKTKLLLFFAPMLLMIGGFGLFVAFTETALPSSQRRCPIQMPSDFVKTAGSSYSENVWTIYSYDGTVPAPQVVVEIDKQVSAPGRNGASCKLIVTAPKESARDIDWRIGHILPDISALRGKTVTFRFTVKADRPLTFDTGTAYIYDGLRVNGVTIDKLDVDWREFVITHRIPEAAVNLEFWFRLMLDKGTMRPNEGQIHFMAAIEPGATTSPTQELKVSQVPEGQQEVFCRMAFGPALSALLSSSHRPDIWSVYRYDGSVAAPQATVGRTAAVKAPAGEACEIKFTGAPEASGAGVDWRVGHIVMDPAKLHGKTITFKMDLLADRPVEADTAVLYLYDGINFVARAVPRIGTQWQTETVNLQIAPNATTAQAWLRLVYDKGTIKPGSGSIYYSARLE